MADTRNAERVAALAAKERERERSKRDHHDHRTHHHHHRRHHESGKRKKPEDDNDENEDRKKVKKTRKNERASRSKSRNSSDSSASEEDDNDDEKEAKHRHRHRKEKKERSHKRRSRSRSESESPSSASGSGSESASGSSESSDSEEDPRPLSPTLKMRRRHRRKDRNTKFDMTPEQAEQLKSSSSSLPSNSFAPSMGFYGGGTNMAHTRHARRIYVGGIGSDVTEADMTAFFNAVIERVYKPMEGGAVVSVYINHERKFAFVELREIALATAAMELDGIPYNGQPLKIRRPNDYTPSAIPAGTEGTVKFDLSKLGIVSTTVEDGPNKVFVGGLPHHLNEKQVQELLQAFGRLKSFHLVRDVSTGTSKGYGFCEFVDPEVTDVACEGLNNMQIGDRVLTVRRATAQDSNQGETSASQPPEVWQPPQEASATSEQQAPSSTAPSKQPTQYLQLCHMVTPDMLSDDQEYEDIMLDVKEECEQYGSVKEVRIPRSGSYVGNIYIHFGGIDEAISAATALAGRMFESRLVSAEYVTEGEFQEIPSN